MVLTDMPFQRGNLLHKRYNMLGRPDSAPPVSDEGDKEEKRQESKRYAAFLKDQERKVGPDGFLDSSRYTHTFTTRKDYGRPRAVSDSRPQNVVSLTARVEKDKKDYDKRIKVIEDLMWQHKQEERELKRVEGDIIKNQRAVRHVLRDYENAINKKRMSEEKKLNVGLEKYTKLQMDHVHKKEEVGRQRVDTTLRKTQEEKYKERQVYLKESDLLRKYRAKVGELETKRVEILRLSTDFESQMRSKEVEQHKLKQELADLAISLNMETQKGRVMKVESTRDTKKDKEQMIKDDLTSDKDLDKKLGRGDGDIKAAEMTKSKLAADLALTKAHLDIKKRDEQRHLTDTQIRLEDNVAVQRQLNEAARHAEMELKAKQIDQRLEAGNYRRVTQLQSHMKQKKETEQSKQVVWEARFKKRYLDAQRREHEDSLNFFQKMVTKGEETEQNLYNKVRNNEYLRQKQEQKVRRLHQELAEAKRQNAAKIKQEMTERQRREVDLEQKLVREKAELDKVHSQREESYLKLQQHRHLLQNDKHNLVEHEREHQRLVRIGQRSDVMLTDIY